MQAVETVVSIVELKELARRLLRSNSVLRMLILSEPDYLARQECLIKLMVYVKLLYQELKRPS